MSGVMSIRFPVCLLGFQQVGGCDTLTWSVTVLPHCGQV
jgi:hypothetical protein